MASVQNHGRLIIIDRDGRTITTAAGPVTVVARRARAWLRYGWPLTTRDLLADTRIGLRHYEREPWQVIAFGASRAVALPLVWALCVVQWAVWTPARQIVFGLLALAALLAAWF